MIEAVLSQNKIPIRLTDERWAHITEEHCELAGMRFEVLEAMKTPSSILAGGEEELLAIQETEKGKFLVVVYRELNNDGFIITLMDVPVALPHAKGRNQGGGRVLSASRAICSLW